MTDQFRAMCAELTERLEWFIAEDETNENDPGNQYWLTGKQAGIDSVTRARALLAQPAADGLTDQELLRCGKIATPCYDLKIWERELNMMRAAIAADRARRGHPTPQPVAYTERLQAVEALAADAVSGLRYIEQTHGRLYGVGWDRVFDAAAKFLPANALPTPKNSNG